MTVSNVLSLNPLGGLARSDTDMSAKEPLEAVVYRINAGSTDVAAIDDGPDWVGDLALENGNGPVSVTGEVDWEYTSRLTNAENEVTYTDPAVAEFAPWQLFVHERYDRFPSTPEDSVPLTYNFDVQSGATYRITLLYVENWPGAFLIPDNDRIFDVLVDEAAFSAFADISPLQEVSALLDEVPPPRSSTKHEKQPFLGTVLTRELLYTAIDDELNLAFIHDNQNPKINAIQITQILEGPGGIALSPVSVAENERGAEVGSLAVTNLGSDAPHEFHLSDRRFEVVDGTLKLKDKRRLDFEEAHKITLSVTATDENGMSMDHEVTFAVKDVGEGRLSAVTNVIEGSPAGETLKGGRDNDLILGHAGADEIFGRKGDDIVSGGRGADTMLGGRGFDTLDYSDSLKGVTVNLQAGTGKRGEAQGDSFKGFEGVIGSDENDRLLGSKAANLLIGGKGADLLNGRGGEDWVDYHASKGGVTVRLAAGSGSRADAEGDRLVNIEHVHGSRMHDKLVGDRDDNILVGDVGRDTLMGGKGHDTLLGGGGNDTLVGGAGHDKLLGHRGHDKLSGGAGNDKLVGGAGRDKLDGGAGNDIMLGRSGADSFVFGTGHDRLVGGSGRDTVKFDGAFGDYDVTFGRKVIVTIDDDRGLLLGMEQLAFDDVTYVRQGGEWVELG